ncbi:MmgE/PrpD family protein [Hydrogenophaga sp. OTU3427]|uniref:MmgE/PrpD family protein n=1 Tax=Hydrogenophaga sp. OTU3427 TaxID=3043856 RepID=UPI00406CE9CD
MDQRGGWQSRTHGGGDSLPATAAIFLNALSESALDYESLDRGVHPDALVVAVAMAVGQREEASGSLCLIALIAGSELICRLARASQRDLGIEAIYRSIVFSARP